MLKTYKDKIIQTSTVLFVLNMMASVLNYICQLFMAKILSVESFGTINTIFSFLLIVSVPGSTLTMIVAKYYAEWNECYQSDSKKGYMVKIIRYVLEITILFFGVCMVAIKPLSKVLAIDNFFVLSLTFLLGALSLYHPLYSGVFSGNGRFVLVGIYSLFIPLYKIIAVFFAGNFIVDDLNRLYTVLFVMILGTIVTALAGHFFTMKSVGYFSIMEKSNCKVNLNYEDVRIFIMNICLMFYMNIDLLVVRYYGNSRESGLYSSALLFGRVIYYFATTLGTIILPTAATLEGERTAQIELLNKAIILMMVFTVCCALPFNICGNFFIKLFYGEAYLGAQRYIKYVSLISIALSLCTLLTNYLVGIAKTKFATFSMIIVNVLVFVLIIAVDRIDIILAGIGVIGIAGAFVIYGANVLTLEKMETERS